MGDIRIITLRNTDKQFYSLMGPFLSRREIVKELGDPVWDDDGKTWCIAISGKNVAGFAAFRPTKDHVIFCSAYVIPSYRKKGIYTRLIKERLEAVGPSTEIMTMARKAAVPALAKAGFVPDRETMNYQHMRREAK